MYEIEFYQTPRSKLVGDEEPQIGEGGVDRKLARDGAAVGKSELNTRYGPNAFLKGCGGCSFGSLEWGQKGR